MLSGSRPPEIGFLFWSYRTPLKYKAYYDLKSNPRLSKHGSFVFVLIHNQALNSTHRMTANDNNKPTKDTYR